VDSKDFQLLVGLYGNARQSYLSLSRRVSLSAPAVRDRLNHLRSKGVLQGFTLVIDSSVFDRDDVLLFFDAEYSRKTVLAAFAAADVTWVAWKVDGRIHLRLWTKMSVKRHLILPKSWVSDPQGELSSRVKKGEHRFPSLTCQ
jgi:DNA-binding Lrp family transcriptional regulator